MRKAHRNRSPKSRKATPAATSANAGRGRRLWVNSKRSATTRKILFASGSYGYSKVNQERAGTMRPSQLHGLVDIQTREQAYTDLVKLVSACRICPRMDGRTRVLGIANGSLRAKILFIAEAPGRLGAEISGIPLHGDQTGRNFQKLLDHSGINRDDVFITNAVLCNPRDENNRNTTPTRAEVNQCSVHLLTFRQKGNGS